MEGELVKSSFYGRLGEGVLFAKSKEGASIQTVLSRNMLICCDYPLLLLSQTTYSTFYVMVSFLNKHLEFQDKVVNINKFLVNVTTWQYDKAQFDNGSKGANVRLQPKGKGKAQGTE